MSTLTYLQGYPESLLAQVTALIEQNRLGEVLKKRYPQGHDINNDKALYQYTQDLKSRYLRGAAPINKVMYDNKIHVLNNALGLHTAISRVQGGKLKAKGESRNSRRHRLSRCAGGFSADDRGARAGAPEGKRAQQSVLSAVLPYGAAVPSAGV